jgi:formylglycine-generating enzyme required for sulfatase activity
VRNAEEKYKGEMLANFKRGRGDNMGTAGHLNDNADIPAPVYNYLPNDYGLFNMAGNVAEWVKDAYRPLSPEDVDDFNPYRGNVFVTPLLDDEGQVAEKDSLGRIVYREVDEKENAGRRNYTKADYINAGDGDENENIDYKMGSTTLIDDNAYVIKGGSWKDRAYWMSPGARRYLDMHQSTDWIGFRCSMIRVGSPVGFSKQKKSKKRG